MSARLRNARTARLLISQSPHRHGCLPERISGISLTSVASSWSLPLSLQVPTAEDLSEAQSSRGPSAHRTCCPAHLLLSKQQCWTGEAAFKPPDRNRTHRPANSDRKRVPVTRQMSRLEKIVCDYFTNL